MPWKKEETVLSIRKEFVSLADREHANMSQLCKRFGISRKTGYKWLRRWRKHGEKGLHNRSRRPHTSPNRTPGHIEQLVLEVHEEYPEWGSRKLYHRMERLIAEEQLSISLDQLPAPSTILKILKRHDRWQPHIYGPDKETMATSRFEREAPNQLWQMDFKGEFSLGNQQLCYPLTLIDDHSRFNLALAACPNMRGDTVTELLRVTFRRYGLPLAMLMDNGNPWGDSIRSSQNRPYYTQIGVWLMRLGIRIIYSRPGHPQTHGKNERFNGTLKAELLRHQQFNDLREAQTGFDSWRDRYNLERPHQGIGDQVPMDRYKVSPRNFPEQLSAIAYNSTDETRKVSQSGYISYQSQTVQIGRAFAGYPVAIRPQKVDEEITKMVYFCHQPIREIPRTNDSLK